MAMLSLMLQMFLIIFITMSTILNSDKEVTTTGKLSPSILLIIIGILSLLVIGLVIVFIVKKIRKKPKKMIITIIMAIAF
ncbi:MAG: hypothetical protein L6V91_03750 [Bacilli bacterium]|nr:MAG: hypothetical protein L6V91_03750 [Bacilli bacterium]